MLRKHFKDTFQLVLVSLFDSRKITLQNILALFQVRIQKKKRVLFFFLLDLHYLLHNLIYFESCHIWLDVLFGRVFFFGRIFYILLVYVGFFVVVNLLKKLFFVWNYSLPCNDFFPCLAKRRIRDKNRCYLPSKRLSHFGVVIKRYVSV